LFGFGDLVCQFECDMPRCLGNEFLVVAGKSKHTLLEYGVAGMPVHTSM